MSSRRGEIAARIYSMVRSGTPAAARLTARPTTRSGEELDLFAFKQGVTSPIPDI
jgi:hypothetical protein